jgi:hypothetical protein
MFAPKTKVFMFRAKVDCRHLCNPVTKKVGVELSLFYYSASIRHPLIEDTEPAHIPTVSTTTDSHQRHTYNSSSVSQLPPSNTHY